MSAHSPPASLQGRKVEPCPGGGMHTGCREYKQADGLPWRALDLSAPLLRSLTSDSRIGKNRASLSRRVMLRAARTLHLSVCAVRSDHLCLIGFRAGARLHSGHF